MPFGDLLQFVATNQNTGTLQVRKQQILKMIFFEKGKIISSSSSDPKDYLGHFLVSQGYITENDLRIAMEVQRSSRMLLGKILVMSGKVSENDMVRLLKLKTEETIYSLFFWDEGEFTFYDDEFVNRLFVRISLDPQGLIFEGVLRKDEWLRIRHVFPNNNILLERIPNNEPDLSSSTPLVKTIFELVDGKRTIEDIILAAHSVDYPVCNALFRFYEDGYLRITRFLEAPTERRIAEGEHAVELLSMAGHKYDEGKLEDSIDLLREIKPSEEVYQKVIPLLEKTEREFVKQLNKGILPPEKILKLLVPLSQLSSMRLTPEEGFVLSRIDGNWDIRSILSVTPMKEVDALRLMKRLVDRGIIGIK